MKHLVGASLVCSGLLLSGSALAETKHAEQEWGIAAMYRTASIPFYTANDDSTVSTFVPMMFFENEHLYIDGIEGGVFLFDESDSNWRTSAIMRLRFVDIPKSIQNAFEGDLGEVGRSPLIRTNCASNSPDVQIVPL